MPDDALLFRKRLETSWRPEKSFSRVRTGPFDEHCHVVRFSGVDLVLVYNSVTVDVISIIFFPISHNIKVAVVFQLGPPPNIDAFCCKSWSWIAKNVTGSFRFDILNQSAEATCVSALFKAVLEALRVDDGLARKPLV